MAFITNLAMQQIPFLAKFKDGWPVECILMQFLKNHNEYKRQKEREMEFSGERDSIDESESASGMEMTEGRANKPQGTNFKPKNAQHISTIRTFQRQPIRKVLERRQVPATSGNPAQLAEEVTMAKADKKATNSKNRSSSKSTTHVVRETQVRNTQSGMKESRLSSGVRPGARSGQPNHQQTREIQESNHSHSNNVQSCQIYAREDSNANGYDKEDQLAPPDDYQAEVQPWHPSLGVCPNQDSCSDPLPSLPEQPLELQNLIDCYMSLLARKKRLVEKRRTTISDQTTLRRLNVELTRLELYMCSTISRALNLSTVREAAKERGWPMVVNFMALAKSAWTLEVVLGNLLLDPSRRKSHFIWTTFLARVASSFGPGRLDKFASASLQKLREYGFDPLVYTGYYGYKGQYVIHQTLMAMFGMVSRPEMIDIEPLSFLQFTEQFLIPFVAVHTISQELDISLEDAFGILQQSTVTGKQPQPEPADNDPDIHAICSYNLDRKRVGLRRQPGIGTGILDHLDGGDLDGVRPLPKFQKRTFTTPAPISSSAMCSETRHPAPGASSNSHARQPAVPSMSPLSPVPHSPHLAASTSTKQLGAATG
ncbi:hypothetical protein J3R82DRAFT_3755 [Butyriboletus roseoflavus]|nr:hypothetical protein J3R82DRAFT_3755 [Butyriboletus roseoflavus]